MPRSRPHFQAVTTEELHALWPAYKIRDIRRLILEVERYRRVIDEIERYRVSIDRAWHDEAGGQLAALYSLRLLLKAERERLGVVNLIDDSPKQE